MESIPFANIDWHQLPKTALSSPLDGDNLAIGKTEVPAVRTLAIRVVLCRRCVSPARTALCASCSHDDRADDQRISTFAAQEVQLVSISLSARMGISILVYRQAPLGIDPPENTVSSYSADKAG